MNKFQPIDFKDIADFLAYLPEHELKVVQALRHIILEALPDCKEKLAYNVPYYYVHSRIVFIWPASVPWGKVREEGVMLGFCRGHMLPSKDVLDQGTRKEVYVLHFTQVEEIDEDLLRHLLFEAVEVDATIYNDRRGGRK